MSSADYKDMIAAALDDAQKSTKGWYRANCPICVLKTGKEDKRWSMGFHPESARYKCFRCQTWGVLHDDFSDMSEANPDDGEEGPEKIDPPSDFMPLGEEPAATAEVTQYARWYLEDRNVPLQTWQTCDIGVSLQDKLFKQRIIVPIKDDDETWFGYVGRLWDDNGNPLRYRYPAGMARGSLLWNHHALYELTDEPIILVEGVFDALPHYPYAISCLGKPSHGQMPALYATNRPIVVALDGDAWMEAQALAMKLKFDGKRATFLHLPPKTDPGDLKPGELYDQAVQALRVA